MATLRMHVRVCFGLTLLLTPIGLPGQQKIQLPARDKLLSEKPVVLYALGAAEGEDWELLSGVRAVAFDASDNLYVLDGNNFRVLVFDAAGKFVRSIGKKGQGPGELMAPNAMTVMTDGRIVVTDLDRRAYSLFRSDGRFLTNVVWSDSASPGSRLSDVRAHPRSGIVAPMYRRYTPPAQVGAPSGERKMMVHWVDFAASNGTAPASSTAAKATQLYEFTLPSITPKVEERGGRTSITRLPVNWTPPTTFGVLPNGGLVVAHEAEYRVKLLNSAGKLERIIERLIAPRKGTQKDKDNAARRQAEDFGQAGNQQRTGGTASGSAPSQTPNLAAIEEMFRNATWLELIPVLRRVATDPQGRIWVARTPADFGIYGPIDLMRANGAYIGTITNAMIPGAVSKNGRAAYIERDEFGVEHVTVKRLPATWQ